MSHENRETVRRAIAAINARDIDAYLACCAENVELLLPMVGAQYLGPDGIRRFFTDIEDIGPDFLIEVQRMQATSDGGVLALIRISSTGRASGIATEAKTANVYDFIDGRISRIRIFLDRDEALRAVGLAEEPIEVVRKQFEALNRRDLDGVISHVAEDGVLDGRADLIEGRAAIRGFLDEWFGAYEELDYELEEVSDLGGGVVFAVVIQNGRLVGTDGHIRQREGWVYLFTGGSIARVTTSEVDQARAAAERLAVARE